MQKFHAVAENAANVTSRVKIDQICYILCVAGFPEISKEIQKAKTLDEGFEILKSRMKYSFFIIEASNQVKRDIKLHLEPPKRQPTI